MAKHLTLLVKRELGMAFRRSSNILNPLGFFIITVSLFPFALGDQSGILPKLGGGILWMAALLASMMSFPHVFEEDYEDGSLEQLLLSGMMPSTLIFGKMVAHWVTASLPLIVMSPFLGLMLGMGWSSIYGLMLSLILGTPSLTLIGIMTASLTVGLRKSGAVLALLMLPLTVPILIFGSIMVISHEADRNSYLMSITMLGSLLLVFLPVTILASAAAITAAASCK